MTKPESDLEHHLDAVKVEGISIADYARRHGLNPRQLYDYRYLRQQTTKRPVKTKPTKTVFSRVAVPPPRASLARIQLANGIVLELDSESLVELLPVLKAL